MYWINISLTRWQNVWVDDGINGLQICEYILHEIILIYTVLFLLGINLVF
jgi:hypothetical protein